MLGIRAVYESLEGAETGRCRSVAKEARVVVS